MIANHVKHNFKITVYCIKNCLIKNFVTYVFRFPYKTICNVSSGIRVDITEIRAI